MAKKYNPDPKGETAARITRTEAYAEKVRQLFAATVNEIMALNKTMPDVSSGVMYSFDGDSKKIQVKVESLLRRLHSVVLMTIEKGIRLEWAQANAECDRLVRHCFGKNVLNDPKYAGYTNRNADAMEAFIKRSEQGTNLSDRVWKSCRQLRDEMEVAITVAVGQGEDAGSISRQVRKYLNDPDLMFRRFQYHEKEAVLDDDGSPVLDKHGKPKMQDKLDKSGNPIVRKKWKKRIADPDKPGHYKWIDYDRDSYIPKGAGSNSRGVYKSSAKNAMRLARTETNIAYRRADNERWSQMDFVIGQRVQLSKSHPKKDICDKLAGDYPKDFVFEGWHPQCFCFVTPILMDEDEFLAMEDARLAGKTYKPKVKPITDYPAEFKNWVRENEDKITDRGISNPYFIEHNQPIIAKILRGEEFDTPEEEPELITRISSTSTISSSDEDIKKEMGILTLFDKVDTSADIPTQTQQMASTLKKLYPPTDKRQAIFDDVLSRCAAGKILTDGDLRLMRSYLRLDGYETDFLFLSQAQISEAQILALPDDWKQRALTLLREINASTSGLQQVSREYLEIDNMIKLSENPKAKAIGLDKISGKTPIQLFTDFEKAIPGYSSSLRKFPKEFFDSLKTFVPLRTDINDGCHYSPSGRYVCINPNHKDTKKRLKSDFFKISILSHEFGHAMFHQYDWSKDPEIRAIYDKWVRALNINKGATVKKLINDELNKIIKAGHDDYGFDEYEQLGKLSDSVQAAIRGHSSIAPMGHKVSYFKTYKAQLNEIIAHCSENTWVGNPIFEKIAPGLYRKMRELIKSKLGVVI